MQTDDMSHTETKCTSQTDFQQHYVLSSTFNSLTQLTSFFFFLRISMSEHTHIHTHLNTHSHTLTLTLLQCSLPSYLGNSSEQCASRPDMNYVCPVFLLSVIKDAQFPPGPWDVNMNLDESWLSSVFPGRVCVCLSTLHMRVRECVHASV